MEFLKVKGLKVNVDGKRIVDGVNLSIGRGEIHVIMGPNGSGKSTLCYSLMGHSKYDVSGGEAWLNGENLLEMAVDERARKGLFLGFQYPREVQGLTFGNFLRLSSNKVLKERGIIEKELDPAKYFKVAQEIMGDLKMDKKFIGRSLNAGFSGGEKKRAEVAQMLALKPKVALLDEIDSGLDVDALKSVAKGILKAKDEFGTGMLIVTHYQRILDYMKPDFVHVFVNGKIVESGGFSIVEKIEESGYEIYQ